MPNDQLLKAQTEDEIEDRKRKQGPGGTWEEPVTKRALALQRFGGHGDNKAKLTAPSKELFAKELLSEYKAEQKGYVPGAQDATVGIANSAIARPGIEVLHKKCDFGPNLDGVTFDPTTMGIERQSVHYMDQD